MHNCFISNSVLLTIPVLAFHGPEEYNYLAPLCKDYFKSLINFYFILKARRIKVTFVNVGDMSCRWKVYQIGGAAATHPIVTIPLHKDLLGDMTVDVKALENRDKLQERGI